MAVTSFLLGLLSGENALRLVMFRVLNPSKNNSGRDIHFISAEIVLGEAHTCARPCFGVLNPSQNNSGRDDSTSFCWGCWAEAHVRLVHVLGLEPHPRIILGVTIHFISAGVLCWARLMLARPCFAS
jgi:hypothetical protein